MGLPMIEACPISVKQRFELIEFLRAKGCQPDANIIFVLIHQNEFCILCGAIAPD